MGKVLFLFITAVLLCGWGVNASVLSDNYVYKEIIIKENDTLWDIAAKETDNRMDIREYIYTVKRLNAIKNSGNLVPRSNNTFANDIQVIIYGKPRTHVLLTFCAVI